MTDVAAVALPPLSPALHLVRAALVVVVLLGGALLVQLLVLSPLHHRTAQDQLFDAFRADLALGTAPLGSLDFNGDVVPIGTPIAYLDIPAIDLRQVVVEGTTASALFRGPGHRRDTPLPGQVGVSIIAGRRATYGGPFARLSELDEGDAVEVTTGQGEFEYEVVGVRREGDPLPEPIEAGESRLVLATADGRPLLPDGVLRVDAELATSDVVPGAAPLLTSAALPDAEEFLGADAGRLWALALWLQGLVVLAIGAVWAWHRWGRPQAWIVFVPPLLLVSFYVTDQGARLLPNLL